jgi:phosphoserine phosphatase
MVTDETPIAMLTVGELREILKTKEHVEKHNFAEKKYVYGLRGIRELFRVSHATAQKYKDTILKDAITQHGRKIITDVEKALELFNKAKY